ncbi:LysR family transcriptional regulator [Advenella mimigardefordensis]|uniref:Transcriptional regulator, LysR family n=1 Tax=Advenella mimigardefordensis (strain DSM 17166 / LMG 22922 / DPN7) TaxID=1247726 RepID=W0PHY9_ADVMD|nr:LysR family transcriptional regulator [Advenella mimigardefordensis]AHG66131.1 transcriptional regulator, LysR family [Advenella mimigardefordensis DPN7]
MIRELKTFIAVSREGTFAGAAHKIGLTQAAVSAQMHRLEDELGFALFDRQGRAAKINARGQQLLLQAQELIQLYSNLGATPVANAQAMHINVGAIATLQRTILPNALAAFHKACPGCHTRIIPGVSMDMLNLVDAGEVDMAAIIRPPFQLQSELQWQTLAREPFRLIVPSHVTGDDWAQLLSEQPFIRYDRASFGGRLVDRFLRNMHIGLNEICECDELETIARLVENGAGVALFPQTAAFTRWPAGIRGLDLGVHTFYRETGLLHRQAQSLAEPVRQLVQFITQSAQQQQALGASAPSSR